MSILKNTSAATKWVAGGMVIKQGMRLVSNLVMTRILPPEAFGIMAIVNMSLQALNMFSDIGLRPSIIKSDRSDSVFLNTAWTVQIVRGMFLWLLTASLAWPISKYYGEPILLYVLPCSGLMALCMGFNSISVTQNEKQLLYSRLIILDNVTALIGLMTMVVVGIYTRSVWALVLGGITSTLLMTLFGYLFLGKISHRFFWDKNVVHELFHFGKWVFLSTALTFFVGQYDKLALGKLANMTSLGLYSIAMVWAQLPVMIISQFNNKVIYPIIAEYNRRGELQKAVLLRKAILRIILLISIFMVAAGHIIIKVFYEHEYVRAADILTILSIAAWFEIIEGINTHFLLVVGRPKDKLIGQILGLIILSSFMSAAYLDYEMNGVALLAVASMMVRSFALDFQLRKEKIKFFIFDIKMTLRFLILGFGLHWLIINKLQIYSDILILIVAILITLLITIYVFFKQTALARLMNA